MATSPEYAAALAYAFKQGKTNWSPSSSEGSDASVDQASPPIFYHPPANNTYFTPTAPLYPYQSFPILQENLVNPYQTTFAQPQTQFLLPPAYIQPNQNCAAPSLLFGRSDSSKSVIPIPVCASPSPSSGSALVHTPASEPVFSPERQMRTPAPDETRGYTEKAPFMPLLTPDGAVSERPASEGRKRSRTAQACEKCRIRKARCFGGNPCQRCTKRRLKCEFSEATRHRGSAKLEQLTPVRHFSSQKRPKIIIHDDSTPNNRLGLELPLSSEDQVDADVDAEGEDEDVVETDDGTPWHTNDGSFHGQVYSPLYGIEPSASTSATFGYPTPISPSYPHGLDAVNVAHGASFMNYAADVKRQAEQQLAYAACDNDVARWASYIPNFP